MQRCTRCWCDTPDGSPPKCKACVKRDEEFGSAATSVHFVGNHVAGDDVDADPDAWSRAGGGEGEC